MSAVIALFVYLPMVIYYTHTYIYRVTAKKGRPQTEAQRVAQQRRRSRFTTSTRAATVNTTTMTTDNPTKTDLTHHSMMINDDGLHRDLLGSSSSPQPESVAHSHASDTYHDSHSDGSDSTEETCDSVYTSRMLTDDESNHDHRIRTQSFSPLTVLSPESIDLSGHPHSHHHPADKPILQ
ncbi:hypothetical protein BDF22DRAFT_498519 [Syncephalis plumigaleata]|nr:hypothetical protein BDF22DRAFT_498519 [Syncephalis plumigaleata]